MPEGSGKLPWVEFVFFLVLGIVLEDSGKLSWVEFRVSFLCLASSTCVLGEYLVSF